MKKKPPGVAISMAASASPTRIQYHQIIVTAGVMIADSL